MKRFTETTKWDDPWFMDLPVKYKAFWFYVCDRCDNAGAWEPNMRLAIAQIGEPLELVEILRVFAGRIQQLKDGKLWITKFISFQYGNLSPNCRAHIPILHAVEKLRLSKGYPKGIHTLMEKEMDKEKVLETETPFRKSENLLARVRALFHKRASTPLDTAERKAWKGAQESVEATSEKDWQLLEWLYAQRNGDAAKYRHQCMATLLNNWNGQIEKARARKNPSTVQVHSDEQPKYGRNDDALKAYG